MSNIRELAPWQNVVQDADAGYAYLRTLTDVRGDRLGIIGFCWGGEMTFSTATQVRGLKRWRCLWPQSEPDRAGEKIEAPVMAHYGEKDPGVNQDIPATMEAMKKFNRPYDYKIYPGAQHGFYSEGNADRYNPEAAKEAWAKTLDHFKSNLQT